LSRPEPAPRFSGAPADETGPVFAEPWQAQAFALVTALEAAGAFTWRDWAAALAAEVSAAGAADDGSRYYEHWLAALERLAVERGLTDLAALADRKAAWEQAYLRTSHGRPVELEG